MFKTNLPKKPHEIRFFIYGPDDDDDDDDDDLLYPYFGSLIPVVSYAVKFSIFDYNFCCNCFIRFDTISFRGLFRTPSNIYDRAFY